MLRRAAVWSGWLDVVRNAVRTARAPRTSCLVMTLPAPVTRAADAVMTGPMLIEWIASWLLRRGVDAVYAEQLAVVASISTLLLCAWIVNFVTKRVESYREQRAYQVAPGVPARGLESTAAPANVHWIKDADVLPSRQTPGGGSQTAIPYNQHAGITPSA